MRKTVIPCKTVKFTCFTGYHSFTVYSNFEVTKLLSTPIVWNGLRTIDDMIVPTSEKDSR